MDWRKHVKKYVWDENKTPYLIPVVKLSKPQAQKEIFIYALFVAVLFSLFTLILSVEAKLEGNFKSIGMAFYAFSVICAAVLLGLSRHVYPAYYCVTAPVAAFIYIAATGLNPNLGTMDHVLLMIFTGLWARYTLRVVAIADAYPEMADQPQTQ